MSRVGLIGWALGSIFFFYAFALRVSPSVMVDELMRDYGVSALVLGNLSAFYFYAYASVQIPVGVLMDRVGPRWLMGLAALTCAGGCFIFAFGETIMWAYTGRLLIGLGCAFSWVGVLTIIGDWLPSKNYAVFTGGGQFAGTTGAIVGQAPLAMIVAGSGWRTGMLMFGVFGVVLAAAICMLVRDRPRTPQAGGTLMAGLRQASRNPQTWIIAVVGMSLTGPILAFAGLWGVPWFRVVHAIDRPEAASILSVVFIGWLVGAPLTGYLSDRLRRRKLLLAVGTAISTTTITILLYVHTLDVRVMAALLFVLGLGGSSMILTFAASREHNPREASGATLGIVNMFVVASGALFQPLIGWLLDRNWTGSIEEGVRLYSVDAYNSALIVLPVFAGVGFLMACLMREPLRTDA